MVAMFPPVLSFSVFLLLCITTQSCWRLDSNGIMIAVVQAASITAPLQSVSVTRGTKSNQPISVLSIKEQSGTQDNWDTYIEFKPSNIASSKGFLGTFTYKIPSTVVVDLSDLEKIRIETNCLGQQKSQQRWLWHIRNPATGQWVYLGDNTGSTGWNSWYTTSFELNTGVLSSFVNSNKEVMIRYQTTTAYDVSNLDLLKVVLETQEAPPPTSTIWTPAPGTTWQWQISGVVNTTINVDMYDIDLFDNDASVIDKLHRDGRIVICYFSAGSYEDWRPDANAFPSSVLGNPLEEWEGERWLDIRQYNSALGSIMKARLDMAQYKGCDGVEPDNIDGYINSNGLGLTFNDQLAYNSWLANEAHLRGLSIGLKNDLDQIASLVDKFDWALNEQCNEYNECETLLPFIQAGKAVFGVEYTNNPSFFCPYLNGLKFSWMKKNWDLDAWRQDCRDFA